MPVPTESPSYAELARRDDFLTRHIGPSPEEQAQMLAALGCQSLTELIDQTLPAGIRLRGELPLAGPTPEHQALARLRGLAAQNRQRKSLIGLGYHDTLMPSVLQRNVLENPGWYTAYTPYQAEIAQGRLEALLHFQQLVCDLTGLDLANASLLDEATAAAEAMTMARRVSQSSSDTFLVDAGTLPQTLDVLRTRARFLNIRLLVLPRSDWGTAPAAFGALLAYPDERGEVPDLAPLIAPLKAAGTVVAVASDPLALVLLKPPGQAGADIVFGSMQRFGIPMGFGGPHAAFFAARSELARQMPGRLIGVSRDSRGRPALRMALQTREQHIRREKANSNICTSQVLLANLAVFYAIHHGPHGLRTIAQRVHRLTAVLVAGLRQGGFEPLTHHCFDTVQLHTGQHTDSLWRRCQSAGYNLRRVDEETLGLSVNEAIDAQDVIVLLRLLTEREVDFAALDRLVQSNDITLPAERLRQDDILSHPVFHQHHGEHALLRYLKQLQNKDLALDHAMIPLGSCTMKLNPAAAMQPLSWPEFTQLHPFAPLDQARGTLALIEELEAALRHITGFDHICMQPNSGAQGEYAGLVAIRRYLNHLYQPQRTICLIPRSAHGTNPASAQLAGLEVVIVDCDDSGNVRLDDLRAKAEQHAERLACLMLTYPSTHGVFEEAVQDICAVVHRYGGQVYMDGANLNALVGLSSPVLIGADVAHINLHKTFAIPHGGGGPGMGPIGVKAHLAPFLPNHRVQPIPGPHQGQSAVSAAPWGSAAILPISWMYISLLGGSGLTQASRIAILNANYLAQQLGQDYSVLYTGRHDRVAHECILDLRPLKAATGISEIDVAKRLMDYGFHAPTVSFPVPGTLMIEPTESENLAELHRFIAAMHSIRGEIRKIEDGIWPADNNPLKHAPHTTADLLGDWDRPYSLETAVFPLPWIAANKFWPSVNRIDDVYGDRHFTCACPPITAYD